MRGVRGAQRLRSEMTIKDKVAIVAASCTPFGEHWDRGTDDLLEQAAREALDGPWGRLDANQRAAVLHRVADGIQARFDEFVAAEVADTGRPEKQARNLDVQRAVANFRTFADLIKMAMLKIDAELQASFPGAAMLLQVHDELLLEAPAASAQAVAEMTQRCMSQVATLKVPLKVDVGIGASWADAH